MRLAWMSMITLLVGCTTFISSKDTPFSTLMVEPQHVTGKKRIYSHEINDDLFRTYHLELLDAHQELSGEQNRQDVAHIISDIFTQKNHALLVDLSAAADHFRDEARVKLAKDVFTVLATHEVTRLDAIDRYDSRGDIGFCFGRAMQVHHLLRQRGVDQSEIAKIFAIGKLRLRNQLWNFHMATMVKAGNGEWLVIDNMFEEPLSHQEWAKRVNQWDIKELTPQVRFYVTDPRKFQPSYAHYDRQDLLISELREYFEALALIE